MFLPTFFSIFRRLRVTSLINKQWVFPHEVNNAGQEAVAGHLYTGNVKHDCGVLRPVHSRGCKTAWVVVPFSEHVHVIYLKKCPSYLVHDLTAASWLGVWVEWGGAITFKLPCTWLDRYCASWLVVWVGQRSSLFTFTANAGATAALWMTNSS